MIIRLALIPIAFMPLAQAAMAQITIAYTGTFVNTALDQSGTVEMTVTYWPNDSISGYVDNDNYPGEDLLCGAGNFTGLRVGDSLFHQYTAFDPDPGCDFSWGIVTYLRSKLHNGLDSISGAYFIDPTPGVGGLGTYHLSATPLSTGIDDAAPGQFAIWPNPAKDVITVQRANPDHVGQLRVTDAIGQVVLQVGLRAGEERVNLNLSKCAAGIYFVETHTMDGGRVVQKLIKE